MCERQSVEKRLKRALIAVITMRIAYEIITNIITGTIKTLYYVIKYKENIIAVLIGMHYIYISYFVYLIFTKHKKSDELVVLGLIVANLVIFVFFWSADDPLTVMLVRMYGEKNNFYCEKVKIYSGQIFKCLMGMVLFATQI